MIKKIVLITILLVMLTSIVSAIDSPYLTATLMKYEPQPAEPGKYVKVFVKLENTGTGTAKNSVLQIIPEYPFSLDPGKTNEEYVGSIGGGSFHTAEFTLKVDENAVEGTNKIKVRYNIDEAQQSWNEKELDISIQTQDAVLSVEEILITPENVAPGSTAQIKLVIENLAKSYISDIKVKVDLSSATLPFAPHNSATEKNIYQLKPSGKKELTYEIIAYPDAEAKIYKIPVSISYYDNVGTLYEKTELIGVIVNSKPDIKVVVDSTTLLSEKKTGDVVLKIVNKGLNDVKLMNMVIGESEDFELLTSNAEQYIGNLDSDDFETVDFEVLLKEKNVVSIPLSLEYLDNNNNLYKEDLELKLTIHSAEQLGQKKSSKAWLYVVIIVVVAGFLWYRKRKKSKKK